MELLGARICRNCKHFDKVGLDENMGECHLHPPSTQLFLMGVSDKGLPNFHRVVVTQSTPTEYWCAGWTVKIALAS